MLAMELGGWGHILFRVFFHFSRLSFTFLSFCLTSSLLLATHVFFWFCLWVYVVILFTTLLGHPETSSRHCRGKDAYILTPKTLL